MLIALVQAGAVGASAKDEQKIYDAVLGSVVRPELEGTRSSAGAIPPPAVLFDRTTAHCDGDPAVPPIIGTPCLSDGDIDDVRDARRAPFLKRLSPAQRDELAGSLRRNNRVRGPMAVAEFRAAYAPPTDTGPIPAAPQGSDSLGSATFSHPGYTSDGLAVVFVSYARWGYDEGWLVLLRHEGKRWRVVESYVVSSGMS
jgi:hypothetical protein